MVRRTRWRPQKSVLRSPRRCGRSCGEHDGFRKAHAVQHVLVCASERTRRTAVRGQNQDRALAIDPAMVHAPTTNARSEGCWRAAAMSKTTDRRRRPLRNNPHRRVEKARTPGSPPCPFYELRAHRPHQHQLSCNPVGAIVAFVTRRFSPNWRREFSPGHDVAALSSRRDERLPIRWRCLDAATVAAAISWWWRFISEWLNPRARA